MIILRVLLMPSREGILIVSSSFRLFVAERPAAGFLASPVTAVSPGGRKAQRLSEVAARQDQVDGSSYLVSMRNTCCRGTLGVSTNELFIAKK